MNATLSNMRNEAWNGLHALLVANLPSGSGWVISQGDFTYLDRGANIILITTPASFERRNSITSFGQFGVSWEFYLEVYVRHNRATELAVMTDAVDKVIQVVEEHPTLNGTAGVTNSEVESGDDIVWVFDAAGGGPHYVMQRIRIRVDQVADIVGGEYA